MIDISEFGIKIKNISAGTLYDVNLGTRDYFSYTEAMLNNSLFSAFLIKNGLNVYKGESTRDIICLDFDFGTRSYEDEHKRIKQLYENSDGELKERLKYTLEKVENNKDLYDEKKREQIRDKFYNEGVDVTYKTKNKDGSIKSEETIHYEMLFRTSAKAKLGQVIFINSELYKVAYEWLTIGLGKLMTDDNAKIVEMSAYAPLTTSTIVGRICRIKKILKSDQNLRIEFLSHIDFITKNKNGIKWIRKHSMILLKHMKLLGDQIALFILYVSLSH